LKHYEDIFAAIEKRVMKLMAQNRDLRNRIKELEQEIAEVRRKAKLVEHLHGEKLHVKEKIAGLLQSLENTKGKDKG
jgi:uncharacterized protein YdcH (DUF465 family)